MSLNPSPVAQAPANAPVRLSVLNYPVDVGSQSQLLSWLENHLAHQPHVHVVTLNPEMIMRGDQDPEFGSLLKSADVILPDGIGVVWALKHQGHRDVERIAGIEFSEALLLHAVQTQAPIALIGASPEVNAATVETLSRQHPNLRIAYAHHGFFETPQQAQAAAQACAQTHPRYVFVAMGVPHQERWIHLYHPLFQGPTAFVGIGGSFDVWSGLKKRAHPISRALNLEWLWRIASEPWRIKRVYKTLPMFVVKVMMAPR